LQFGLYRAQLLFCIQHSLSESSTFLYLQFGLYGAQLHFCIEHNLSESSTILYLQFACIEHNFFFESNTTYQNRARFLIFETNTTYQSRAQLFVSKPLTPRVCGGATSRSLELKIMPPSRRPHHAVLAPPVVFYHKLYVYIKLKLCVRQLSTVLSHYG